MPPHGWRARYGFALAYLICFAAADLVYVLLSPHAQAVMTAWASTSVANLEHEPILPLVLSAFVVPDHFGVWPLLIALAVFGANRALGSARTALVCVAGHVVGTVVSEGIVAYRVDAGLLPVADRYLVDVGPSYVVVAAIVVAVLAGTWPARVLALADFAVLVIRRGHLRWAEPAGRGRGRARDLDHHRAHDDHCHAGRRPQDRDLSRRPDRDLSRRRDRRPAR